MAVAFRLLDPEKGGFCGTLEIRSWSQEMIIVIVCVRVCVCECVSVCMCVCVCAGNSTGHIYHRMCSAVFSWCCWHEWVQNSGKSHAAPQNAWQLIAACSSCLLL